jgi:hypothetical protein
MKRILTLALALTLSLTVRAQPLIAKGQGAPKKIKNAHWYFDTAGHTAWTDLDLEWTELGIQNVSEMYAAGTMIIVHSTLGYSILGPYGEYIWASTHLRVTDSLVMAWDSSATQIFLLTGRQLHPENGFNAQCWRVDGTPETVQGISAYCLPDFQNASSTISCDSLHAYGMFGFNGHWLIPPQYDTPFTFVNGVAEVSQNGNRRKINEKGEFVD